MAGWSKTGVLLAGWILLVAQGAQAASTSKAADKELVTEGSEDLVPEASSAMPMLLVPSYVDGRKSHYIFVSYRLVLETQLQVDRVNQKVAWLHDAFMRDVFKSHPTLKDDPHKVDREYLVRRFKEISAKVLGDDIVIDLYFHSEMSEKGPRLKAPPQRPKKASPSSGGH